MTDREAIALTLARYCHLCDDGLFDEWARLYADDATFTVMGRTYEGPDAIKGFIVNAQPPEQRGKHFLGQSVVEVDQSSGTATAVTDYTFITGTQSHGFTITSAGRYYDSLCKAADGRWLFRTREIRFLGD